MLFCRSSQVLMWTWWADSVRFDLCESWGHLPCPPSPLQLMFSTPCCSPPGCCRESFIATETQRVPVIKVMIEEVQPLLCTKCTEPAGISYCVTVNVMWVRLLAVCNPSQSKPDSYSSKLKGYSGVSLIHGLAHRETVLDCLSRGNVCRPLANVVLAS